MEGHDSNQADLGPVGKRKSPPGTVFRSKARRELIDASGRFFQLVGLPRSTGQIFGLLYLSVEPLALDDVAETLGISRGSVSTGLRLLGSWGALRQVWIPGERRDFYEGCGDLDRLVKKIYSEAFTPRLTNSEMRISTITEDLEDDWRQGMLEPEEYKICQERLKCIAKLQKRVAMIAKLGEKFLK